MVLKDKTKAKNVKKTKKSSSKSNKKSSVKKIQSKDADIALIITNKLGKNIAEEQFFYLKDGKVLKNVLDLINAFDEMNDEIFSHHVNIDNNDFSNWICNVLEEEQLANEIKEIVDKVEMHHKLLKHTFKKIMS